MAKQWTVMVYMAAEDSHELDLHAIRDIKEMERVGSNPHLDVVVQVNRSWPSMPQRYHVLPGESRMTEVSATGQNMGNPNTLWEYLRWVLKHHPAEHYFLVLWGHAYGLGFGRDHDDPLTLPELKGALSAFRAERLAPEPTLDLLGANACAMSYVEAAFELRDAAQYLVASEIAMPFAGWPYESILRRIKPSTTAAQLGRIVADSYVRSFAASPENVPVAMSLLNLQYAPRVAKRVKTLTEALNAALEPDGAATSDRLAHVRTAFRATVAGDVRPLVDMFDLCTELESLCEDLRYLENRGLPLPPGKAIGKLQAAARALRDDLTPATEQIGAAIIIDGDNAESNRFVMYHKRHEELAGLHGVGIFAPFVTDDQDLIRLGLLGDEHDEGHRRRGAAPKTDGRAVYKQLELSSYTTWGTLVYDELRDPLPPDVVTCIQCTGAASRSDKSAVSQMLVAVDSTFDKLDWRLAAMRQRARLNLSKAMPGSGPSSTASQSAAAQAPERVLAGFGTLQLLGDDDLLALQNKEKKAVWRSGITGALGAAASMSPAPVVSLDPALDMATGLLELEQTVAEIEMAARRTLTHGTFGLGPFASLGEGKPGMGLSVFREGKPGMGAEGKPGMGEGKPGMGEGKPGMGEGKPGMGASAVSDPDSPTAILLALFGQVGESFKLLEGATREFERTALEVFSSPLLSGVPVTDEYREFADKKIERAFRDLGEASSDSRRTLRRVLAHPAYGFGPGSGQMGTEDRRELARLGGLRRQELALL